MIFLAVLLPATAIAQDYQGMGEADMQKMMQGMQEAEACMQGIDQSGFNAFRQRVEKLESDIKDLCAGGKRDAAQAKGLAFAKEVNTNPDIRKMRECTEKMRGMLHMPQVGSLGSSDKHVCDQ